MTKRRISSWIKVLPIAIFITVLCATAYAAAIDNILLRWRKTALYEENTSNLTVAVTYYSAELKRKRTSGRRTSSNATNTVTSRCSTSPR